jgi:hypothetical protein
MLSSAGAPIRLVTIAAAAVLLFAATAQANTPITSQKFTASSYPVTFTGTSAAGNETIKTEGGTIECAGSYHGTASEPSTTIRVTPTFQAHLDIECTFPKLGIVVTAGTCKVVIPSQTGITTVDLYWPTDITQPEDLKLGFTGANITYNVTEDGFLCPFSGTGHRSTGTYTSDAAFTISAAAGKSIDIG